MCPNNRIGTVDLLLGLHHGQASSNSEALVHALHPSVAIMNNGTRKGGEPETMKMVYSSPGLEDLWQMHFSLLSGQEYTVPGMFIANDVDDPQPNMPIAPMAAPAPGPAAPPTASAQRDGVLDQSVRAIEWHIHGDQCAKRFQQGLREREVGTIPRRNSSPPRSSAKRQISLGPSLCGGEILRGIYPAPVGLRGCDFIQISRFFRM